MNRLLRPLTFVSLLLIVGCLYLFQEAAGFKAESALLPVTMLLSLIVLGSVLLFSDQRKTAETSAPLSLSSGKAFFVTVGFVVAVDLVGFYPTLVIGLPLIAYLFGFKNLKYLVISTALISAIIFSLFDVVMMKEFPLGVFG
jgi:putative tricarboxylic transport membrane protein